MRLEQLVLFGPSDNFCISFGPKVTVLAGLAEDERAAMITTLVDAMAGRLPNASVIFVDEAGRRVFADRVGATYADSGVAAPSLSELLGTDPAVIADLVTVTAEDLGLGDHRDAESLEAEVAAASAALEQVQAEHAEATTFVVEVDGWKEQLAELDRRIAAAPEEAARWRWLTMRNELDELRAELADLDRIAEGDDDGDDRLLAAVEELRSAGEAWAEASAAAEDLAAELGPLPPVSEADLARVASTPDALPEDFEERVAAVATAAEVRAAAERAFEEATAPAPDPGDYVVYHLASVDQQVLWDAHAAVLRAQAIYDAELKAREEEADPEAESAIELAHREVVRCQREIDRRFRPGLLGCASLVAGGVLAALSISILVTIVMVLAAGAMGVWLLVLPRKALAEAEIEEQMALAQADAGSWLGLHLRRIDDVMQPTDRKGLNAAADLLARAKLDWEDISHKTSLTAASEREEAIRALAAATDPKARAVRERTALDALADAKQHEVAARRALTAGLEGYGLADDGAADLDPDQIRGVLEQRIAAGRFARRAVELVHQTATATSSGAILDRLLRQLGFDDGDLAGRLERAIVAVEAARTRRGERTERRDRGELEQAIAALAAEVERGRRMSWDLLPDPTEAPEPTGPLMDRRRALAEQIDEQRLPDLVAIERRVAVASDRLRSLQAERASLAEGPAALRRRLADRIARTTWIGPNEEALPILIDDALAEVEPGELFELLDMIVRLSNRTQVLLLTSDATVARWARREAEHGDITLFESDAPAVF